MSPKPDAPTVDAYQLPSGLFSFWCPYCERPHVHGGHEGYREAHCTAPRSAYRGRGYHLRKAGAVTGLSQLPRVAA